jgi:hypothetical protein
LKQPLHGADLRWANLGSKRPAFSARELQTAIFDETTILDPRIREEVEDLRKKRHSSPEN